MMRRRMKGVGVVWLAAALFVPTAHAGGWGVRGPLQKLTRGTINAATGVVEIPSQVFWTTETEGSLAGVSVGVARGIARAVKRTVVGVFEAVTFIVPNYPKRGGADRYGSLMEPEFVVFRPADKD